MHIGRCLKAYATQEWPTKSEFCRTVGISPQLLNAYAKSADVRHSTLVGIADKIGMDVETLMATLKKYEVENGSEGNQAPVVESNV
jgi:hypothetical protein